jgi:hypothetical protein
MKLEIKEMLIISMSMYVGCILTFIFAVKGY